jgi:hypothetical protein
MPLHSPLERLHKAISGALRMASFRFILAAVIAVAVGAFTGLSLVEMPSLAWVLVGAAAGGVLLLSPAWVRIAAAVLAAVCSRLLVATGMVSSLVNFFHFPLILGVALLSMIESPKISPMKIGLEIGLLGLLAVSLVSWMVNGGELLRPILDWLVFCEPLLLVYAIVNRERDTRTDSCLWILLLFITFGQLPFVITQVLTYGGPSDMIQGFFIGLGAGAHVAGGVALLGTLLSVAKALESDYITTKLLWFAGGAALFLVCILADAKQAIIAFLPALALLLASSFRIRWSRAMLAFLVLSVIIITSFIYYRPLQQALDWQHIVKGLQGKIQSFGIIADKLSLNWSRWILGLGPGNSISRVAQMGLDAYVNKNSPIFLLGLAPAATTREIYSLTASSWLFSASSAFSGISSWIGLLGDLGIAGVVLFAGLYWKAWSELGKRQTWHARVARPALLMMVILGFLYNWLEEPGFTAIVALILGLGLTSQEGTIKENTGVP